MVRIPQVPGAAAVVAAKSALTGGSDVDVSTRSPLSGGQVKARPAPAMPVAPVSKPSSAMIRRSPTGAEIGHSQLAENVEARWQALHEDLKKQAERASEQMSGGSHKVEVAIDERSRRFVMKVVDMDSGLVVRQFPPESVLKVSERLDELSGMLLAKEA